MTNWKHTIKGLPQINREVWAAIKAKDYRLAGEKASQVTDLFLGLMNRLDASPSYEDDALWFREEDPSDSYWQEDSSVDGWVREYNYRLNQLYDWADANRVWVNPQ